LPKPFKLEAPMLSAISPWAPHRRETWTVRGSYRFTAHAVTDGAGEKGRGGCGVDSGSIGAVPIHDDEILVTEGVVRRLIESQFPEWSDEPIHEVDSSGTVNAIFRVGDDHAARFPLRRRNPGAEREALEVEARASTEFSAVSPVPCPRPVALGEPGEGYPLPWSLQTWLAGDVADGGTDADSSLLARDLAALITALRDVDPAGRTFRRGSRGGDLRDHDAWMRRCFEMSRDLLDVPTLALLWDRFVELPRTEPDVMSHGDLIPGNVLVAEGRVAGILDCGGFGPADPALDLITGWHLLDDERRAEFRAVLAPDDLEWERSKAWAFEQSMGAVWYYEQTNPPMCAMGKRTLARILADTTN
jgi:aminoglycoside phosphotransferase (APT) family kinase protein